LCACNNVLPPFSQFGEAPDDVWLDIAQLVVGVALEIIGARMYLQ